MDELKRRRERYWVKSQQSTATTVMIEQPLLTPTPPPVSGEPEDDVTVNRIACDVNVVATIP
jgi:hypothetical protein